MAAVACSIDSMIVNWQNPCNTNGTEPDWTDDYSLTNLEVYHTGAKVGDVIEVVHSHLIEQSQQWAVVDATEAANGKSYLWAIKMRCDINVNAPVPGWVPIGTFTILLKDGTTGDTLCTASFTPNKNHVRPCSVCTADKGNWNVARPSCWPDETPPDACSDALNYAPDPDHLEHTPLRYVKVMLHIFQVADTTNPSQPDPINGPQHFSSEHIDLIKSWIDGPEGTNQGKLGALCPADPPGTGSSHHSSDSRIRFLLEYGEEGKDIFFHPNTKHWGISLNGCGTTTSGYAPTSIKQFYVTSPDTTLPSGYRNWMQQEKNRNALHIFISRGRWVDIDLNGTPDPNITEGGAGIVDCLEDNEGGFNYPDQANCKDDPVQFVYGLYDKFLQYGDSIAPSSLGQALVGEFLHVVSLDHTSPFQIHHQHDVGDDGCADTSPAQGTNNMIGCDFDHPGGRCHLTQCQLGRMHNFFQTQKPKFERFLVGYDNTGKPLFSSEGNCQVVDPDIVIPTGEDLVWNNPRNIRSNVLVQPGARLTIRCDVGLPADATITVKATGQLIVDGARLYNNCDGDYWGGITVEGTGSGTQSYDPFTQSYSQGFLRINPGSVIEKARVGVACQTTGPGNATTGGIVRATGATFLNCQVRAVHIRDFQNISGITGLPSGSQCNFSGCDFVADGGYTGSFTGSFQEMVRLDDVDGVQFTGACNFTNAVPAALTPTQNDRGFGIHATNAGFSVTGKCNGNSLPCTSYTKGTFTGFDRGILAGSHSAFRTVTVSNAELTDNVVGIEGANIKNAYIVTNSFNVGCNLAVTVPQPGMTPANRGLMLYKCTGYKVEGNTSTKYNGAGTVNPVGILVNASGELPNEVYRNGQSLLDIGNLSNGRNRHPDLQQDKGLQYLCNTNDSIAFHDFAVPKELGASGYGIRGNQGASNLAAGNTFTSANAGSNAELHIQNGQNHINYFYFNQGSQVPSKYDTLQVTGIDVLFGNQCPSKLPSGKEQGGLSLQEKQQFQQDLGSLTGTIESKTYAADMLVRNYLVDTTYTDFTEIKAILAQKGDLEARFGVVDVLIDEGKATQAQQSLAAIPNEFSLAGEALTEYNHFNALKSLQIAALQNGTSDEALVANNLAALTQLATAGPYLASVQAQVLLNGVNGFTYTPDVILPSLEERENRAVPPAKPALKQEAAAIDAQPNPAQHRTVFSYRLPKDAAKGTITVTDLDGREVATLQIKEPVGNVTWDIENIREGIYLYSLVVDGRALATKRLVIVR